MIKTYANLDLTEESHWNVEERRGGEVFIYVNERGNSLGVFLDIEDLEDVKVSDLEGTDCVYLDFNLQTIVAPKELGYKIVGAWMDIQAQHQGVGVA